MALQGHGWSQVVMSVVVVPISRRRGKWCYVYFNVGAVVVGSENDTGGAQCRHGRYETQRGGKSGKWTAGFVTTGQE